MALRVAIVGLGRRGLEWAHVVRNSTLASLAGAVEISRDQVATANGTSLLSGVPVVAELRSLPSAVDAVIVATGAASHAAVVEEAIGLGLAVLVEKPLATDLRDAVRLVRAAEQRAVPLVVAQNYRYMRAHRTVRRIVREGTLGRLSTIGCHYSRASHAVTPELARQESSALWETGVHHLDAMRFSLNRRVIGVAADMTSVPWAGGLQGSEARVLLEFENGVAGTYTVSWASPGHEFFEAGQQFYERLTGERGTLHVVQRWIVLCLSGRWPRFVRRGPRREIEEVELLRQLVSAAGGRQDVECSGRDNLQTVAILEACMDSWRSRRWVNPQDLLRDAGA